jgi:hypothetical protein
VNGNINVCVHVQLPTLSYCGVRTTHRAPVVGSQHISVQGSSALLNSDRVILLAQYLSDASRFDIAFDENIIKTNVTSLPVTRPACGLQRV